MKIMVSKQLHNLHSIKDSQEQAQSIQTIFHMNNKVQKSRNNMISISSIINFSIRKAKQNFRKYLLVVSIDLNGNGLLI